MKGRILKKYSFPLIVTTLIISFFSLFSCSHLLFAQTPENNTVIALNTAPISPSETKKNPQLESLFKKAQILTPNVLIPQELELQQNRYFYFKTTNNDAHQALLGAWLQGMHEYGIFTSFKLIHGEKRLFIRFATVKELHFIYTLLSLKIQKITSLDPAIIAHLIWKESGGKETAVSNQGAIGLTQTLPIVIREILAEKKKQGSTFQISKKIEILAKQIAHASAHSPEKATLVYQKRNLEALLLIPDFTISHPLFSDAPARIPPQLERFTKDCKNLKSIEYLALAHGPLNLSFGIAHFYRYIARIEYEISINKMDSAVEPLLATQMAYNCGINRLSRRIKSLGGWHAIFDIPPLQNGRRDPYLPSETAQYGYLFIKWYVAEKQREHERYMTHSNESLHYKICLSALKRSRTYRHIIKTLDSKGMNAKSGALQSRINHLLWKADKGTISSNDLVALRKQLGAFPGWPLIKEMYCYIDLLVKNAEYSSEDKKHCTIIASICSLVH